MKPVYDDRWALFKIVVCTAAVYAVIFTLWRMLG